MLWFSVACFGVGVSGTFHLTRVRVFSVRFGFVGGRLLGDVFSLGWPCVLFVFWLFVVLFVSRFGFGGLGLGSD